MRKRVELEQTKGNKGKREEVRGQWSERRGCVRWKGTKGKGEEKSTESENTKENKGIKKGSVNEKTVVWKGKVRIEGEGRRGGRRGNERRKGMSEEKEVDK